MKVIDLLNKIANGEEAPKKIKYDTMNYVFRHYDYKEVRSELIDEQSSWLEKIDFYKLNDEVEIIEEDKKIEKLEHWVDVKSWVEGNDLEKGLEEQSEFNKNIYYKINEIIDYLEENK